MKKKHPLDSLGPVNSLDPEAIRERWEKAQKLLKWAKLPKGYKKPRVWIWDDEEQMMVPYY